MTRSQMAPKVTGFTIERDEEDGKEYAVFTFDKETVVTNTSTVQLKGTYVNEYVTYAVDTADVKVSPVHSKSVRVALSEVLKGQDVKEGRYEVTASFKNIKSAAGKL